MITPRIYIFLTILCSIFWVLLYYELRRPTNTLSQHTLEEIHNLQENITVLRRLLEYERKELQQLKGEVRSRADRLRKEQIADIAADSGYRSWKEPIPILVFACNREHAVRTHVSTLIKLRPSKEMFPIIVSQDCDNDAVRIAAESFGDQIEYIKHISGEKANLAIPQSHSQYVAYYRIARHYKLALEHVFKKGYTSVIITEDDLGIAEDFFEYFSATRYLLDRDPMLWCVSAWNDNGKIATIDETASSKLYRSDFFSGLGWMMAKKTWDEVGPIWPTGFWDDWMRTPEIRKNRQCIRPEISRTSMTNDGKVGASKGLFFTKHLSKIRLNEKSVKFTRMDLDYLLKDKYDPVFEEEVFTKSRLAEGELKDANDLLRELNKAKEQGVSLRIEYNANIDYIKKAMLLQVMNDFKVGVPRTAYKGVVSCFVRGVRVYLAPDRRVIKGYIGTWEVPPQYAD